MASAPATRVTESDPSAIWLAARFTSHWGVLPPIVETSHRAVAAPIRVASSVAGAGPAGVMMLTTDTRSISWRRAGTSASAAWHARSIRSTGVTSSVRSMDWPEAMTTGVRSGSGEEVVIGGRTAPDGHLAGPGSAPGRSGAQATIATR